MTDANSRRMPQDKAQLLAWVHEARAVLDAGLGRIPAGQLTAPVLDGARSVKDLLAHIAAWEEFLILTVREVGLGETVPAPDFADVDDLDELNAAIHAKYQSWSLDAVQDHSARVYQEVLRVLAALPDARLSAPTPYGPMLSVIAANTYEHYQEHTDQLAASLDAGHWPAAVGP